MICIGYYNTQTNEIREELFNLPFSSAQSAGLILAIMTQMRADGVNPKPFRFISSPERLTIKSASQLLTQNSKTSVYYGSSTPDYQPA